MVLDKHRVKISKLLQSTKEHIKHDEKIKYQAKLRYKRLVKTDLIGYYKIFR